ncbi:hypothetical protein WR25_21871 [Diploscapter pachys]|uniref:GOLD domain-containing protein n=1 Tax=Diploscapter pachys TaxID=2018661 RepID=A0A2A2M0D3_9BILA|nr:hypothetical protein WR25_21871 [Diploscapter pachys]
MAEIEYPRTDEITDNQKQKIDEVLTKCADIKWMYPDYFSDFNILRWLMGHGYNVDSVTRKIDHAVKVLHNSGISKMSVMAPEEINAYVKTMSPMVEYFAGGVMGQDREGNVIYVHALGRMHPKTIIRGGPTSRLYKVCIAQMGLVSKLIREAEVKINKKLGIKVIIDMDGFSMDHLYIPSAKVYVTLATMLQVEFLGDNWREIICNDFGSENVYPIWGGTKQVPTKPENYLGMGGEFPEDSWYDAKSNPAEEKLTSLNVNARSKEIVRVSGTKGRQFKWIFRVSSGDIDFSIEYDERLVHPVFRCSTEFHPEIDTFMCDFDGIYTFVFSNEHGLIWGKGIKYLIELI